jgi:hypothetical protein
MRSGERMRVFAGVLGLAAFAAAMLGGAAQTPEKAPVAPPQSLPSAPAAPVQPVAPATVSMLPASDLYLVRYDHWSDEDERGFGEFVTSIGESDCHTVDSCLHGPGNPFRASDPAGVYFRSDCADLPYVLRAYYAWKRGLPFGYVNEVEPRGHSSDIRYSANGNEVAERKDVTSGSISGYDLLDTLRDMVSSATYRIHPDLDDPRPDLYSPAITAQSIRPGTLVYDPNGHVATIFRVDPDGRALYIDAHPDNSVTHGYYDLRFVRSRPGMGAGFKNWRRPQLVGYTRRSDGILIGGHVVLPANADIADFSDEQFFGNGPRPASDADWNNGGFVLNGEHMDYYDYVRAKLAGGKLEFDPVKEVHDMVDSNCQDLQYRGQAVDLAITVGIQNHDEPERLPANIYGTNGDWETYSTPSRDARLKTAFKELRDKAQRFVRMYQARDPKLIYTGSDLVSDLLMTYDREAGLCKISYARSDGSQIALSYDEARRRLFLMSFDPYQCIEHRWGATDPRELASCRDDANKRAWYIAEQNLRNQLDRTYDAEMDFSLDELKVPGPGKGVPAPPDIDARAYLMSVRGARPGAAPAPSTLSAR